jgi:hypothetical protein
VSHFLPYYPAQLAPLGATIVHESYDSGSSLVIQYVWQDGLEVTIGCLQKGHIVQKKYRFDQVVYIEPNQAKA